MTKEKYSVEMLFSDSGAFDEQEVIKALMPYVMIQKSTQSIFFKATRLSAKARILAYGLAKKLLKSNDLIKSEYITANELHEKTGMKKGTIDPAFKGLREKGLLVGKRQYEIPTFKIQEVIKKLDTVKAKGEHE